MTFVYVVNGQILLNWVFGLLPGLQGGQLSLAIPIRVQDALDGGYGLWCRLISVNRRAGRTSRQKTAETLDRHGRGSRLWAI